MERQARHTETQAADPASRLTSLTLMRVMIGTIVNAKLHFAARFSVAALVVLAAAALAGCFYPPTETPPPVKKDTITLDRPYDLVWEAVHAVIHKNNLQINAENPNHGIIETEKNGFSLKDADCGQLKGVLGKYAAEPDLAATTVYNFEVKPKGNEASTVSVQATFSAPLHIPLHPPRDVQCVSRGRAEARLLKEIAAEAAMIHRLRFAKPNH
jgi:uncharacterized lipoprotein